MRNAGIRKGAEKYILSDFLLKEELELKFT